MRPLTYILLFVFMVCVSTLCGDPANAVSVRDGNTIELTEAEVEACKRESGCSLVTNDAIAHLVNKIDKLEQQIKAEKSKLCV